MPKKLEVVYVYAGALLHNDELVHSYIRVKADGELGGAIVFAKKMSKYHVGSVIEFTAIDTEDNLVATTGHMLRMWSNRKQVAEWAAMSTAVLLSEEAYQAEKAKPSPALELLEPLRNAYAKLEDREKAILLGTICAYIVGED